MPINLQSNRSPAYFDNVHYSGADFFHSWLRGLSPFLDYDTEVDAIQRRRRAPMCPRGASSPRDGLRFHHGDSESLALRRAGLVVTAIQPVEGHVAVRTKRGVECTQQSDSLVVCRPTASARACLGIATALGRLSAIRDCGVLVGEGDVRSVVGSIALSRCLPVRMKPASRAPRLRVPTGRAQSANSRTRRPAP